MSVRVPAARLGTALQCVGLSQKRHFSRLPARLAALRGSSGRSQSTLATLAGVSIPRLRDAERFGLATEETLRLLAATLGVTVVDLTGGDR